MNGGAVVQGRLERAGLARRPEQKVIAGSVRSADDTQHDFGDRLAASVQANADGIRDRIGGKLQGALAQLQRDVRRLSSTARTPNPR